MEANNLERNSERLQIYRKMSQDEISINIPIREEMVQKAASFLSNIKTASSPAAEKEAFLLSKGLSPDEIRIAFERSRCQSQIPAPPAPYRTYPPPPGYAVQPITPTPFQKFREILHTVALLTGFTYGVYYFIRHVIWPFLFGKPKKPVGVEGAVTELNSSMTDCIGQLRADVQKLHADLERVVVLQGEQQSAVRNLGDIKSEVATVKGILLSRNQFPSVNLAGSTSIPAWQMAACPDSGDRSSEAEVVLPNSNGGSQGSDSSLEMIKEVEVAEAES